MGGGRGRHQSPSRYFSEHAPIPSKHAPVSLSFPKSPYCPRRALLTRFPFQTIDLSSRMFGALLHPFSCVWRDSTGECSLGSWGLRFARCIFRASYRPQDGLKADFAAARLTLRRGSRGKVACLGMAWRRGIRLPLAFGSALSARIPCGWLWRDRKAPPFGPLCERRVNNLPPWGHHASMKGLMSSHGPQQIHSVFCSSSSVSSSVGVSSISMRLTVEDE